MNIVCFTSLTFGDLPRARVLAETLRAAHPDWALWAVLVDRPPEGYANRTAFAGFDRVVTVEQLGIPDVLPWLFRLDLVEACTAVKGAMLRYLLALGAEAVVYLAPGIAVFHPLATLAERLQAASILLTDPDGASFLAVRNDAAGRKFAEDEAPDAGRYHGVAIVRDPGWNVASRSPSRITFRPDGGIAVDGSLLAFCDFSDGASAGEASEPQELWHWYQRRLAAHAEPGIPAGFWHFATFNDGTPIPRAARLLARARPDVLARFTDPFDATGDSFANWLASEAPG